MESGGKWKVNDSFYNKKPQQRQKLWWREVGSMEPLASQRRVECLRRLHHYTEEYYEKNTRIVTTAVFEKNDGDMIRHAHSLRWWYEGWWYDKSEVISTDEDGGSDDEDGGSDDDDDFDFGDDTEEKDNDEERDTFEGDENKRNEKREEERREIWVLTVWRELIAVAIVITIIVIAAVR